MESGMEARYLTNKEGERLGVVVDEDEYEKLRNAREQLAQAEKRYDEAREFLKETLRLARSLGDDAYQAVLAQIMDGLTKEASNSEQAREYLEDFEDVLAEVIADEDMDRIERGEAEVILWERSKARRRGEL
ncbi:hypothetical protein GBA65_19460 [Rubrobacter marinus]|uniref:Uncharacterized protein n=1 Tax=Rubrobacter marinus TaxID=2653852 RepID=A0A6G8Q1Y7_9ACTN|nr:hypothetical protein [Rubrobacter marinus]QIN80337.1 hypothetical protein GBA65_19460 [Rubrobacter marinus]